MVFCANNAADFDRAACAPASAHATREEMAMKSNYKIAAAVIASLNEGIRRQPRWCLGQKRKSRPCRSSGSSRGSEFLRGPRDGPVRRYLQSRNLGFISCELSRRACCARVRSKDYLRIKPDWPTCFGVGWVSKIILSSVEIRGPRVTSLVFITHQFVGITRTT